MIHFENREMTFSFKFWQDSHTNIEDARQQCGIGHDEHIETYKIYTGSIKTGVYH